MNRAWTVVGCLSMFALLCSVSLFFWSPVGLAGSLKAIAAVGVCLACLIGLDYGRPA